jgi:hypothetical protein
MFAGEPKVAELGNRRVINDRWLKVILLVRAVVEDQRVDLGRFEPRDVDLECLVAFVTPAFRFRGPARGGQAKEQKFSLL